MKTLQQQLEESYLMMRGILSEEGNQIVTDILALDEISKEKLSQYIDKASDRVSKADAFVKGTEKRIPKSDEDKKQTKHFVSKAKKIISKRLRGIAKATDRLTKEQKELIGSILEELDQDEQILEDILALNEISKSTLGSYIKKATNDIRVRGGREGVAGTKLEFTVGDKSDILKKFTGKTNHRIATIAKATDRLTKEQKEHIEGILEELEQDEQNIEQVNEGVNDHEALHKEIISKLHKHFPEMHIKSAVHVEKRAGRYGQGEYHKYESEIPIHDSVKHLFKSLRGEVTIHHEPNGQVHGRLDYRYDHHDGGSNGHSVASIGQHEGSYHIRNHNTQEVKKV